MTALEGKEGVAAQLALQVAVGEDHTAAVHVTESEPVDETV